MIFHCTHPTCKRTFPTNGGRNKHWNSAHREVTQEPGDEDNENFTYFRHPYLTASPTDQFGTTLPQHSPPPPPPPVPEAHTAESWFPFSDRVEFDFAHLHFVRLQSSAAEIKLALDMWAAQTLVITDSCENQHWMNADQLYRTIDDIDDINVPWETFEIEYQGPRPPTPPAWMTQKYTLLIRNIQTLFHHQMRMKDFDNTCFNKVPYRQFNKRGERIRSNIMSADWAWKQCDILAEDPTNHGAMFVPFVSGSDKTTVSVATGHQEYHPVYASPCNVTNVTRRSHPFALCPVAFLAIPKTTKTQRKKPIYQKFVRQMYHASLAAVFEPLHAAMTAPEVVMCPDGHYRRVIYGLGPYIADYPEQVYLAGIVSGWCPKCMNRPEDLDAMNARPRTRTKTDFLITCFDPGIVWDEFGVQSDVVPFTSYFPRADIHELLTPDLLHQMIKGTFKDHLVEWVADYIHEMHPLTQALEILKDIDLNAAPPFPGLRRFPDGRDFAQWTGDDSKALMKVYLAAIVGYIPPDMIKAMSSFLDFCYIARRNSLSSSNLSEMDNLLTRFHHHRTSFINSGVREAISLPRQHGLTHYVPGIRLFGSPNGLCSSITESKHIKSVKEPWRRSSRSEALTQMVTSITRSDKLVAMKRRLEKQGMTVGTTFSYMSMIHAGQYPEAEERDEDRNEELHEHADLGPATGPATKSSVHLAVTPADGYPPFLSELAVHIEQNSFPAALRRYLWGHFQGDAEQPQDLDQCPTFSGKITVYHSAISRFYAPSDLCGVGGMHSERIRSHPHWRNSYPRWDTVFVVTNQTSYMCSLTIARVLLFFAFTLDGERHECALVHWFERVADVVDEETGMWVVQPEYDHQNRRTLEVIHVDSIARGCHLLPVFGHAALPEDFSFDHSLTSFKAYFVNKYASNHVHEFLIDDNA
ncbi:hypothetical protein F5051DRAFT_340527 [Lentinula edodes]|nr:hypothetical protein F5051DRAFT_340527 [Lentinula edodes]